MLPAPSSDFCKVPQTNEFDKSIEETAELPLRPVEELKEGSPEHTVHSYCDFDHEVDGEEKGNGDVTPQATVKSGIVKALVSELSKNSLDSMAKDIFSMYVCVRWAPTPPFVKAAESEMKTKHLDEGSAYEHFDKFTFIPLRCSKNVNVYGDSVKLGETHYEQFEKDMQAQSDWYTSESTGVFERRLHDIQGLKDDELQEAAGAFDVKRVRKAVATCLKREGRATNLTATTSSVDSLKATMTVDTMNTSMTVDTMKATTSDLLADCVAAKWWLGKLEDWNHAMPFSSFMSPDKRVVVDTKPKSKEHALVCFGKRVASQLHRRADGDHLITDQSMVGCHGFWEFAEASKMLDRIVRLWRPPTCQLAAMELDMKVHTMELIGTMNTQLFDALPAMLDSEATHKIVDDEDVPLEAASAPGVFIGAVNSIAKIFDSTHSQYARLGQMLGNTVVKWVVCPLKPIADADKIAKLDQALGTEDDLARYYAQQAYAKWTGEENLLPGEKCGPYEVKAPAPELPRPNLQRCSIGEVRENMPERYRDEEFLCPVRPFLPAKQQLVVLQKKTNLCPVRMNFEQMKTAKWLYRGHKPHAKQYDVMSNFPTKDFQTIKLLDMDSHYDSTYYVTRTFVTIGRGCSEKELALTPRFCGKPSVANVPSLLRNLLTGVADVAGSVVSGVGRALQLAGVTEETPSNKAYEQRIASWLSSTAKSSEGWLRSSSSGLFGREAGRYKRLHARHFTQVEASELLHSLSFQDEFTDGGGDSKKNRRFDRFAVMSPCEGFDPNREFRLKYSWSEKAMSMARKVFQKSSDAGFGASSGAVKVQIRSDGVLRMYDKETAWMTYFAHLRASNSGGTFSSWRKTSNPHLLDLVGIFDGYSDASVGISDLLGFEATFACGTRIAMHELPIEFSSMQGSFRECVKSGVAANEKLRKELPDAPFHKDEIVVRTTFKALPACFKDMSATIPDEETVNPTYKNFASIRGCEGVGGSSALPSDLAGAKSDGTYRGMLLGRGLPRETLLEVLIDPVDFLEEVEL